jgi:hypothetical protein
VPATLSGSCCCGAVRFTCQSNTPVPYQRCYCSICRKTAGGGGYAINLGGLSDTLKVNDPKGAKSFFRAAIRDDDGTCVLSTAERHFCSLCGTTLWLFSPEWPELMHPFASAIDSELPKPPSTTHLMLRFKPKWVEVERGPEDLTFDLYPRQSLEDWHKAHGMWAG